MQTLSSMAEHAPIVFIVDDDHSVRKMLTRLIQSMGFKTEAYASAESFLKRDVYEGPACLVLDVRMPGLSGLGLQETFLKKGRNCSIIFLTGHGTIPMGVNAIKAGAVDFLEKPCDEQVLLDAIQKAIERDRIEKQERAAVGIIQGRIDSLTPREYEVFTLVVSGLQNRKIAEKLGVSEKTIKVHRMRVMKKMKAGSLIELVRLAERANTKNTEQYL